MQLTLACVSCGRLYDLRDDPPEHEPKTWDSTYICRSCGKTRDAVCCAPVIDDMDARSPKSLSIEIARDVAGYVLSHGWSYDGLIDRIAIELEGARLRGVAECQVAEAARYALDLWHRSGPDDEFESAMDAVQEAIDEG